MTVKCRQCYDVLCDSPEDINVGGADNLIFATVPFTFVVNCPPGFYCTIQSQSVTIPPNSIPPVHVPPPFGGVIILFLKGCITDIVRRLPATASPAEIAAAAASMQAEWASQQAVCNVITPPPGGGGGSPNPPTTPPTSLPPPGGGGANTRVSLFNTAQTFTATCTPPTIGSPVTKTTPAATFGTLLINPTPEAIALAQAQLNALALLDATSKAQAALVCSSLCPSIIDNILASNFLFGTSCFAPTQNSGVRPDFIFFTDVTGVRWIDDITIQAGSVAILDNLFFLDYASSVNRVYVSAQIAAGIAFIAVVNPDTGTLVTTFNNGGLQPFNYLRYAGAAKDRLYCTQSDGVNVNGRVINPNTNSIVGNFIFSVDAANEFAGGIAYRTTGDKIYVGRQSSLANNLQSVRIFDGTTLGFLTSIDISPMVPFDMIYISDFDRFLVVGADFDFNTGIVAFLDPVTQTVENSFASGTPFPPAAITYNPVTKQAFCDCSSVLLIIDMPTQTITCTVPISSAANQMAFSTFNNKMFHPKVGTLTIETLG